MQKIYCILFLFGLLQLSAQDVTWVQTQQGNSSIETNGLATDSEGNVYAVGYFDGIINFGSFSLASTSAGLPDIFLAKYNSEGTCLWAKKAGGIAGDYGRAIALDGNGNIYITGTYGIAEAAFDGIFKQPTGGLKSGFLAKYDSEGDVIWVESFGGSGASPEPAKVKTFGNSIYIAGDFFGNINFNGTNAIGSFAQNFGKQDVFLVKYSSNGAPLWAKSGGDRKEELANGLAIDAVGNPIVYGTYDSLTTFQQGQTYYVTGSGVNMATYRDLFLVKYSADGDILWSRSFGGGREDRAGGICLDDEGNIYTTGFFDENFVSGSVSLQPFLAYKNLFLHKLSPNGVPKWVKITANPTFGFQQGAALTFHDNHIYLAGTFGGTYNAGADMMQASGDRNPLLIKYDTSGTQLWGRFGNGTSMNVSLGLDVAAHENKCYFAGYIMGSVNFHGTTVQTPGPSINGFICKVTEPGVVPGVPTPSYFEAGTISPLSVTLNWTGLSPEFRLLKKIGSSSNSPDDGEIVYEGAALGTVVLDLTPNTPYFFTLYGKAAGENVFSSGSRKVAAATRSFNSSVEVTEGMIAGITGEYSFGGTGVTITLSGPSETDGYIVVTRLEDLIAGELPSNIVEIFADYYWRVQAFGLSGNSLQFCIEVDHNEVWPLLDYLTFRLLRRPASGIPWEDLNAGSSYTVEFNFPKIKVCGLFNFSEFAIGRDPAFTGLTNMDENENLTIYPNPANDLVNLKFKDALSQNTKLTVLDISGRIVFSTQVPLNTEKFQLSTAELKSGLYHIVLHNDNGLKVLNLNVLR